MKEEDFVQYLNGNLAYLTRAAMAMLGSRADAADAVQEASLKAYVCREQLRGGEESFRPWMRRILLHVCLNIIRQRVKVIPLGGREELIPDEQVDFKHDEEHDIWDAVARLPEQLREMVAMRYIFDLSQDEVAVRLNIPVGTVKSRINRSLEHLRRSLTVRGEVLSDEVCIK